MSETGYIDNEFARVISHLFATSGSSCSNDKKAILKKKKLENEKVIVWKENIKVPGLRTLVDNLSLDYSIRVIVA